MARVAIAQTEGTAVKNESADAVRDELVTEEDLGAEHAFILPDSPLYALKRIGRDVRRVFIFDDAKKVEQEIKDANQELADLNRLLDEKGEEVSDAVLRGFERVEEHFESIADRAPDLALEDEESRREVMEHLLDSEIKRQKVFEHMEGAAGDERVLEGAQQLRERMMDRVGDVVEGVEVDTDVFDRILQNQEGSEFKDLRNLEVLKRLEEKLPESAREGIQRAEDNAFKRLREHVGQFKNAESHDRFEQYMQDFGGDEVIRYEILDTFGTTIDEQNIPEEVREKIKQARDLSARVFQEKFDGMQERVEDKDRLERMREHMMDRFTTEEDTERGFEMEFVDDMSKRMELMSKFKANLQSPELEDEMRKTEAEQIQKFVESFPDAREDAEQAKQTMTELREAGKAGDFTKIKMLEKVLQDLEGKQMQDPNKRAFMEQLDATRREAEKGFVDHLRENGEKAFDGLISDDPEQMEFLRGMKDKFLSAPHEFGGENFDPGMFDRAIKEQSEHMRDEIRRHAEDGAFEREKELRTFVEEKREEIRKEEFAPGEPRPEFAPVPKPFDPSLREEFRGVPPVRGNEPEKMEFKFKEEQPGQRFEFRKEIKDGEEKMNEKFNEMPREEINREFREEKKEEPKDNSREDFREEKREEIRNDFREEKREEPREERREDSGPSNPGPAPESHNDAPSATE